MEEVKIHIANINDLVEFAKEGTVSKTLVDNAKSKIVLFMMSKGQSLSEHTAGTPAIIHVLSGTAKVRLDKEMHEATPGSLIFMPTKLVHAVDAEEDLVFLLTLVRNG
ncbi:MAG TPA: hypothetical protein DE036_07005 [Actinobacteria bacterium]|nr:hypothetical protein [Actinomycetota bacterium]